MNRLGSITRKRVVYGLAALILVGGFGLALLSNLGPYGAVPGLSNPSNFQNANVAQDASKGLAPYFSAPSGGNYGGQGDTQVLGVSTVTVTNTATYTMSTSTTIGYPPGSPVSGLYLNVTQGSPGAQGGMIEFSTNLAITAAAPNKTASAVSALAYSVGGYVAYQSVYSSAAYVVIRVPAADYQSVLNQVMKLGAFVSETSNSNDVSVQYTDLNATLASLRTEQASLLKLLNQTAAINSTLAVESQLQLVDSQINSVESQILQTKTLVDYSTINVTITQTAQSIPLAMTLSATPTNGTAPLSVTFNAIVKGGAQPYIVNYNFGDGSATQGQVVIHTYYQAGDYKVFVSATDQNGTVVSRTATVVVAEPSVAPSQSGIQGFLGYVSGLFLNVVEGIIEVAVVVLPLAAIGIAILIPIQRHENRQKNVKQSQ